MANSNNFSILISFFALWISTYFSFEYQQIIGFVVIFLFGILHGSNDLQLILKINSQKNNNTLKKILIYYVFFVLLGIILFYSLPKFALLLFIFLSAYHFGEQHWSLLYTNRLSKSVIIFQVIYGLFIFMLLFNFHQEEVKNIIEQIIASSISYIDFTNCLYFIGVLLLLSGYFMYKKDSNFKNEILENIFYLIVFGILFKNASLIWGFSIYFVVWHSLPSIKEQIIFLYREYTFKNFIRYFKSAFIYWIISLIGILLLYILFKDQKIFKALFFSFLAAITFPHTLVIMKMQKNNTI